MEAPGGKPPGPPSLAWRSQEALRAGQIAPPPELDRVAPWLIDQFGNKESGFPNPNAKGKIKGYRNSPQGNVYYIRPQARRRHFAQVPLDRAKPPNPTGPFAVLASGRVRGVPGRWGLAVGDEETPLMAVVGISNDGQVILGAGTKPDPDRPIEPDPGRHPAVRKGVEVPNRLALVVVDRYLEVYVNAAAVCDPILLPRALKGTPRISLACVSSVDKGDTIAEFEGVGVVPARLAPLTERGAVPK